MQKRIFEIFKEICAIPHGSGNTAQITNYCIDFAKKNSLKYYTDELGNVVIYKNASKGFENAPTVILQGHLDMVCVGDKNCGFDFEKDGLLLRENEEYIEAVCTSLGGDDGIAVAYALAILESDSLSHPPLEVVFTTDEETGMYGAEGLDCSVLSGKLMINIDSEEEDTLLVSCAGGVRADATVKFELEENKDEKVKVTLSGLTGGHSGTEIDKGRLNAVITLAKLLENENIRLVSLEGGSADNAIAATCSAVFGSESAYKTKKNIGEKFEALKEKAKDTDGEMKLCFEEAESDFAMTEADTKKVLSLLSNVPNGVIKMSENVDGLVETSLNLGIVKTEKNSIEICHALRSSDRNAKEKFCAELEAFYQNSGATVNFHSDYPAWEFKQNSVLQKVIPDCFEEMFGKKMKVTAIHAGLECGLFCGKIEGLDCVSMGPDIFDIHSPAEKLSKKSAVRVFELICKVLASLN